MKSDVIKVTNGGEGFAEALDQAERTAAFIGLPGKSSLHLRLLTEEMMGMMHALTGERTAKFWIESEGSCVSLHLCARTAMNTQKREQLLSASSSGRNIAVKGVTGKLRDLFERFLEPIDGDPTLGCDSFVFAGMDPSGSAMAVESFWSLNRYRAAVAAEASQQEDWDELEKSVVAKLSDEVQVGISDGNVEMIVQKKF